MSQLAPASRNHGGILFPLDMFRPTMVAALLAEVLIGKARNILDAHAVLTRHPEMQLMLLRVEGSVVDGDEAKFWRENADLVLMISQGLRSQCFLYYVAVTPVARQGFVVAQAGQTLAADDATADALPPGTHAGDWPVARLCGQIGIDLQELATGFTGGPTVAISLAEPAGDDRALLTTLIGAPEADAGDGDVDVAADDSRASPRPAPRTAGEPRARAGVSAVTADDPKRVTVAEDRKRRAAEQQAEEAERVALAAGARSDLSFAADALGVLVAPRAALDDTDILAPYVVATVRGDLPEGLPRELTPSLQGRRVDVVVPVEFLSEVFFRGGPLSKAGLEEHGELRTLAGQATRVLEVLGPRLGVGSYLRRGAVGVFVSRTPDLALPEAFVAELLDRLERG